MSEVEIKNTTRIRTTTLKERLLIVGVGNVLHQDDGFGVKVVQRLQASRKLPQYVHLMETGIGGISFVQELYDGYEALLLIDTVSRGGPPGQIYWLEAEVGDINQLPFEQKSDFLADIHFANPNRALMLARALNILPKQVYILGCEPARIGGFEVSLSKVVQEAIPKAVRQIEDWSINFYKENVSSTTTN